MTAITWTGAGGDDNFNNPANWSPQQVPGAGDSVTISTAAATDINLDNGLSVGTLTTNKFVTLDLSNQNTFTLGSGSAGTFANGGTLALNSTNQNTDLIIGSSRESLTAGGTIVLSNNGGNRIYGAAAGDVLVNVNNTIEGGGQLGAGALTLNNGANGRIIADDSNALILNTGSAVITNSGLLEATGSGGLIIQSVVNDGSAGQVSAAGGNVYLQGGDLRGGTLSSSGGAAITVQGGNSGTLDGSTTAVFNDGTVTVNNQGTLALLGTIEYGTIALQSTNQNTDLVIGPTTGTTGTVYLTGGTLSLSDNGGNRIYGAQAGDTLSNQGTISGAGQLGTGGLVLINTTAKGVIDATGTNALVVNTGSTVTNQNALMEATNPSGGLVLQAVINNSSNGTILAAGANVYLQGADIQGGLITSTGVGAITVQTYDTGTLDGTANAVTNTGTVAVNNQGTLAVLGGIVNTGLIALQSTNQATDLIVGPAAGTAGTVTLSGAGTLALSDNGGNVIIGAQAGDTLLNQQTIAGAGQFGYGTLTLINQGTIDATGSNELVVNTGSTVANNSLMEATNPTGGLLIEATVANAGTLLANGANVYLQGADIQGGLLNSAGVGAVTVQTYQSATIDGSSATLTNAGQFDIQNQATLTVLGTLTNTGTISLQSTNQLTEFVIGSPTVTLTGGGVISLSDNGGNDIFGATASDVLDNVNTIIEGSGQLGDSQLILINAATIDATGTSNALLLTGETLITNTALIEATGAAGLYIQNTTVNDITGGTLSAVNSDIFLQNSTVQGGILSNGANAAIAVQTYQAATLDGSSSSVTNTGLVSIQNQATLTLLGTLVNDGTVALGSGNQTTELIAGSPTVTLTGSGTISLSNNGANYIFGAAAADTLDNVNNTIEGAGQLGEGQLTLINAVGGIIDANQSNTLTLNTAGETMSNAGLLESTGGGALQIQNTTVSNTGTILANGGNIYLVSSTLAGGLLKGIAGSGIVVAGYNAGTLDGTAAAVTIDAAVSVQNQGTLTLLGTMDDISGIALQSTNQNTDLIIGPSSGKAGTVTLFDNATITLSDNGANRIYGGEAGDTLLNVKNTIAGAGQLGAGQLTLINDSTIDATGGNALILNTGSGTATNNGLMEATDAGGGGLVIQSAVSNVSGTMFADGGNVYLQGGTLIGGTLNSAAGASINVQSYQTGGLVGTSHAVTNLGSVTVSNQGTLDISGAIINDGTIALQSGNQNTDLVVTSTAATLTGGGTITLSDNPGNRIYGAVGTDVLDNVNNLIEGAGQLGAGQLTLQNHGTIDATGTNALVLSTGSTMVNQALMEATGPGGLIIQAVVNDSSGGTLLTAGGNIYLQGADIIGGRLSNSTGGAVTVQSYNSATLDGSGQLLTNAGTVAINNQGTLSLLGIIANSGTIALQSTNQTTDLIIAGSKVTVSGAGTITMSDNGANRIYGAAAGDVLDLAGGTITGAGQLGAGQLTLLDNGVISATGGNALILSLGGDGTIQGSGALLGIGSGGLSVQNGTYGVVGLVEAESGSSVTFSNGATLTNAQLSVTKSGTFDVLNGGTYAAVAGSSGGATLSIDAAAITGDYADIILSGAGSSMLFDGTAIENSLTGIGGPGTLQILGGRSYTTTLALTVVGTLDLGGGTLTAKSIKTDATSVVSGFGTIATVLTSTGTLAAVGGALELGAGGNSLSGTISGSGTLVLAQANTALRSGTVLDVATLAIIDGATLNLGGPVSFAGTFDLIGPGKLSGAAFTNTGLFEQTGTGNAAAISAPFVNDGAILINAGGGIAFSAGLTNSGTITDNGIFKDTAALTGGTLNIGPSGAGAVIASGAAAGNSTVSTLTMAGGGLNTSGTTLTVTGDYVNSASGTGNGFKPFAGVTGTIDGQGTKLAVVGVDGTTITSVNGTLTITVAPGGSASFEIENTGASGSAALRGALQTTVNGGNITGRALTGSGVTAQNFGPIAAGGTSGVFTIDYSSGPLSGEAIHIASDFANVAGLTIDIVAGSGSATPAAYAGRLQETGGLAATDWIAMHHG